MLKNSVFIALYAGCLLAISSAVAMVDWQKEIYWDWDTIDLNDQTFWPNLSLPSTFKWGVATAALQIEGTKSHDDLYVQNSFTITNTQRQFDHACDHWDRYQEDVQLIKKLGVNQYRFSIAWEKIEPHDGEFDLLAMQHYINECRQLRAHGIEPIVCLFHFKLPVWFYEQGGFETAENMQKFERFCLFVFNNLKNYVTTWITYNEPIAYVMESYHTGHYPPYKKGFYYMRQTGTVLFNMLNTHVNIYTAFKKIKPDAQIGLVHMFHILDTYNNAYIEQITVKGGHHIIFDSVFEFFKTGYFNWLYLVRGYNSAAIKSLDYIGVNYYTHDIVKAHGWFATKRGNFREQPITESKFVIYPEGLYRSIIKAQELNVPIYITENGINDTKDSMRNYFIKQHLYVVQKAIEHGADVRGYTYWCLMDCYGYGLYAVDPLTKNRTLRTSAQPFVSYLNTWYSKQL